MIPSSLISLLNVRRGAGAGAGPGGVGRREACRRDHIQSNVAQGFSPLTLCDGRRPDSPNSWSPPTFSPGSVIAFRALPATGPGELHAVGANLLQLGNDLCGHGAEPLHAQQRAPIGARCVGHSTQANGAGDGRAR